MTWILALAGRLLSGIVSKFGMAAGAYLWGRQSARAKATEKALNRAKRATEIDTDVRRLSESDLDERLRRD